MTQIIPDTMMVFFRPILSASIVTVSAPANEPAGIDATMAPCALEPGCRRVPSKHSVIAVKNTNELTLPKVFM